jgi:5-formyltetrahydrofolate cyclo-ligase
VLEGWSVWREAACVAGYASLPDEASVDAALRGAIARGQRVLLPRVIGDGLMEFVEVRDLDADTAPGAFGIREPVGDAAGVTPDLVLVPGLAFTRDGARLGMGGGFYDRWAEANPGARRVGVYFAAQVVGEVPREGHDVGVSAVVTEDGVSLRPE